MRCKMFFLFICFLFSENAFATGVDLPSVGIRGTNMGTAHTGAVSDSSAVYWNPAALSKINNGIISTEFYVIDFISMGMTYTDINGNEEGSDENVPIPGAFIGSTYGKFGFGLGLYCPYGQGSVKFSNLTITNEGGTFSGVDLDMEAGFFVAGLSVAYQVNDNFSIGVTGEILNGMLSQKMVSGGNTIIDSEYEGFGGVRGAFGMLYNHTKNLNIGFTIKSESTIELEGEAKGFSLQTFTPYDNDDAKYTRKLPYSFALGAGYNVSPDLVLALDLSYRMYGSIDEMKITQSAGDQTVEKTHWRDNYGIALGAEYRATEKFLVRGGISYFTGATEPDHLQLLNGSSTDTNTFTVTGGAAYQILPKLELSMSPVACFGLEQEDMYGQKYSSLLLGVMIGVRSSF